MNTPPGVSVTHGPDKHKTSLPSFLPGLKSFSIENLKFKHYNHLMLSDHLEKLVVPDDKKHKLHSRSSLMSLHHVMSPLDAQNRQSLHRSVDLTEKLYDDDMMRETLWLKIEQERTKQAQYKTELAQHVLDLLQEAGSHGFGGELIRKLFLDDSIDHYHDYMHTLHGNMDKGLKRSKSDGDSIDATGGGMDPKGVGVTAAGGCTRSASEGPGIISESVIQTPHTSVVRTPTPTKLPGPDPESHTPASHNIASNTLSAEQRKNLQPSVSLADAGSANVSNSTSNAPSVARLPNLPVYPHAFPVYYTQMPEQMQTNAGITGSLHDDTESGLPYMSQQYPGILFQSLPQQVLVQGLGQMSHMHGQQLAQGPPYYYVNSLPPGIQGPVMTSQYFIPPPLPGMVHWGAAPALHKKSEDEHHPKRQRGSKNSINFMITTPKNPPAKKYNKL